MMERSVAVVVANVHIQAEFFDQVPDGGQPPVRRVPVRVAGEAFAVPYAGGGVNRPYPRTPRRDRANPDGSGSRARSESARSDACTKLSRNASLVSSKASSVKPARMFAGRSSRTDFSSANCAESASSV